ncbi:COX15/CtaA family protein [Anthocerotibacter panamensis]|uniref:COX15/CtaA family protein n=1 Tax=Anthocerotibacter panamensis TaxID=2857077 RepID=UPI001C402056|nr:COX15/CtaA family protein [Anthocerotibacter panamensis]
MASNTTEWLYFFRRPSDDGRYQGWFSQGFIKHGIYATAVITVFLMAVGGMTRVMNAGLACPDWPLCYGSVLPAQMDALIFWEWFHRVIATTVGAMTLGLTGLAWWGRKLLPRWLPWAMTGALMLVLVQGALGALTVTELLRFDIVTAHLGTATLFFAALLTIGMNLGPRPRVSQRVTALAWVALGAALVTYGQLILGGLVASQWALNQCLGDSLQCQVMHNHLWGVAPTLAMVTLVVLVAWRSVDWHSPVAYGPMLALLLVALQVGLGLATYMLQLQVPLLTVAHLVVGIGLFASMVVTTVLAFRAVAPNHAISAIGEATPVSPATQHPG